MQKGEIQMSIGRKKQFGEIYRLEKSFNLTFGGAKKIIKHFHSEMAKGLAGKKSSLAMIPTFVSMPSGNEAGRFIALDLGGTNFRILDAALKGSGVIEITAEEKYRLQKKDITGTGRHLFGFIAESIKSFMLNNKIDSGEKRNLGFTFSFPIKQLGIANGILLRWNKGFSASNVIGKDVVKLMDDALNCRKIGNIKIASLINDTVGTLAAKRYRDSNCDLGVIFGTGTNACYPEKITNIKKMPELKSHSGFMIINIEWGNFNKLPRTLYDRQIDRATNNPGRQRLEKMVSGLYLGEITRIVLMDLVKKEMLFNGVVYTALRSRGSFKTEYVSRAEEDNTKNLVEIKKILSDLGIRNSGFNDRVIIKKICRIVLRRSAYIGASATAAVLLWMDPHIERMHTVAIDGSLFEKCSNYKKYIEFILRGIFKRKKDKITLALTKDGSGKGAAVVAATASQK